MLQNWVFDKEKVLKNWKVQTTTLVICFPIRFKNIGDDLEKVTNDKVIE